MKKNLSKFNAPSTRSVLSFLFLPEFKRSFPAFAHIGPVFIRTIAIMFVQAGLLRPNHPALLTGMSEDVPKFKFSELLGEAWYNLRTGDGATPYQYGAFISVIMMIGLTITSAFLFLTSLFMSTAQAQLFAHPSGEDTSVVESAPGGSSFFQSVSTNDNGDLAIDLLNKVLRQSAYEVGKPMQNALGALMEIYNTALLVIASLVVFWAIISIVVDTARTGQIGGGRHSIVWVPIRFVFALALMIPLMNGFNGGQMMVMKVAEWGSNLGSQAWFAYVESLQSESLAGIGMRSEGGGLALAYARMEVCRTIYNELEHNASNGALLTVDGSLQDLSVTVEDPWMRKVSYRTAVLGTLRGENVPLHNDGILGWARNSLDSEINYNVGTAARPTLCGTLNIGNPNNIAVKDVSNWWNEDIAGAEVPVGSGVELSRKGIRMARLAHYKGFEAMVYDGQKFACDFVSENSELSEYQCTSTGATGVNDGVLPSAEIIGKMAENYEKIVNAGTDEIREELEEFIGSEQFLGYVRDKGWAGMGAWYQTLQRLNSIYDNFQESTVSITGGDLMAISWANQEASENRDRERDALIQQSAAVMSKFNDWWRSESLSLDADSPLKDEVNQGEDALKNLDADNMTSMLIESLFGNNKDIFIQYGGSGTRFYPMTQLIMTGKSLLTAGMAGYAAVAVISGVSAIASGTASGVPGAGTALSKFVGVADVIMGGPIGDLISTLLMLLIVSGMVLKYYIPLLPWIRVMFSVLAWIVSVFEAIVVVPILALMNLSTEGDGLFTQGARNMWVLGLNLLLRPILTVIGFVASLLLFNSMVLYVNDTFLLAIQNDGAGLWIAIDFVVNSIIYVIVIFTLANTTFKTIDTLPSAVMRWMNAPQDVEFQDSQMEGIIMGIGQHTSRLAGNMNGGASRRAGEAGDAKRAAAREEASSPKGPGGTDG